MEFWLYKFFQIVGAPFFKYIFPIEAVNKENIPTEGPVIICANHISMRDPFAISSQMKPIIRYMAKGELFENKLFKKLMHAMAAFPVARGQRDIASLRTSLQLIKENNIMGIFPEGHRYKDGIMRPFQTGIGFLAIKTNAKVIPVYIDKKYKLFRKTKMVFGSPIDFTELKQERSAESLEKAAHVIEDAVKALQKSIEE